VLVPDALLHDLRTDEPVRGDHVHASGRRRGHQRRLERFGEADPAVRIAGAGHVRLHGTRDTERIVGPLRIEPAEVVRDADPQVRDRQDEPRPRLTQDHRQRVAAERVASVLDRVRAEFGHRHEGGLAEDGKVARGSFEDLLHRSGRVLHGPVVAQDRDGQNDGTFRRGALGP